jgi:hypothetical protein
MVNGPINCKIVKYFTEFPVNKKVRAFFLKILSQWITMNNKSRISTVVEFLIVIESFVIYTLLMADEDEKSSFQETLLNKNSENINVVEYSSGLLLKLKEQEPNFEIALKRCNEVIYNYFSKAVAVIYYVYVTRNYSLLTKKEGDEEQTQLQIWITMWMNEKLSTLSDTLSKF